MAVFPSSFWAAMMFQWLIQRWKLRFKNRLSISRRFHLVLSTYTLKIEARHLRTSSFNYMMEIPSLALPKWRPLLSWKVASLWINSRRILPRHKRLSMLSLMKPIKSVATSRLKPRLNWISQCMMVEPLQYVALSVAPAWKTQSIILLINEKVIFSSKNLQI